MEEAQRPLPATTTGTDAGVAAWSELNSEVSVLMLFGQMLGASQNRDPARVDFFFGSPWKPAWVAGMWVVVRKKTEGAGVVRTWPSATSLTQKSKDNMGLFFYLSPHNGCFPVASM